MAAIESDLAQFYGFSGANYLQEFIRRNPGFVASNYFVECRIDATGLERYYIHAVADAGTTPSTDSADPAPINLSPGDPTVAAEDASLS